jgi:hypothetical protein
MIIPDSLWSGDTRFSIRVFDVNTNSWVTFPASLIPGSHTLSGPVSQLGIFGLFGEPVPIPTPPLPIQPIPAGTVEVQGQPVQNPILNALAGLLAYATANLSAAFTTLLIALAGLYAYTRRDQIARYQTWITLYLISMTGVLWASFIYTEGGPLQEPVFLVTTVIGLNLIVHVLRFDRVVIPIPAMGNPAGIPLK